MRDSLSKYPGCIPALTLTVLGIILAMMDWPQTVQQHIRVLATDRARYEKWPPSYPRRPFWRLFWNACRGAQWMEGRKIFEARPEVMILIPPGVEVQRKLMKPIDGFHLHFSMGMPLDLYHGEVIAVAAPEQVDSMTNCIAKEPQSPRWRFVVLELISHALAELSERTLANLRLDGRVETLLQYMQAHTHQPIRNDELARLCHLSEAAMIRLFTQHVGRSPQVFFRDLRLDEAAGLLRQRPEQSIDAIATRMGFVDRSHFSKRFAQRYGITPAAYRKTP